VRHTGKKPEGIDQFLNLAKRYHVVPMLVGHPGISFSPLHVDDFNQWMASVLADCASPQSTGVHTIEMCGPEFFNGIELAARIARHHHAVPMPIPVPLLQLLVKAGLLRSAPDQVERLVGAKTSGATPSHQAQAGAGMILGRFLRAPDGARMRRT
jgi:hypothetical protein